MLSTPFTELLGCRVPLQQAPMGGVTTPELVAAVAGAGAVGMVPAQMLPAEVLGGLLEVLDAVEVPVVAGGGVATARGVAACLAAGAAAVRVGTRLLATEESGAHPRYVAALLEAGAEDAVLTDAFSVMWPGGPE